MIFGYSIVIFINLFAINPKNDVMSKTVWDFIIEKNRKIEDYAKGFYPHIFS